MSKVPFNPRTAAHALRGLALGTSCSLVLISEERRRRLDVARALVDNARLIKAQRCYSSAGGAAAILPMDRAADALAGEGDIASASESSWSRFETAADRSAPPRRVRPAVAKSAPPRRETTAPKRLATPRRVMTAKERLALLRRVPHIRQPLFIFPERRREPVIRGKLVEATELDPLDEESRFCEEEDVHVLKAATLEENDEFRVFTSDFREVRPLQELPQEFLESTMSFLQKLEREGRFNMAQRVIDRLCHHPAIDAHHFEEAISPEFFLRCVLSPRIHARRSSRTPRRFKLAVLRFWSYRKRLTSHEETLKLMESMAEVFAAESAEYVAQSFLATSYLHTGRHITSKLVVVPIAYLYRKQGDTAALARWMEAAENAGVPMDACRNGQKLKTKWELEDSSEEKRAPKGRRVARLGEDLRRMLPVELKALGEEQRLLFDRMDKKAKNWEWQEVLDLYSEGLDAGVEHNSPCLRLAVEAAVGLEDFHSPKALKLIEEAHEASVCIEPVIQCLLLLRFNAIRNHQRENHTPATRGQAFQAIQKLLDTVRPYYKQPSQILYNKAIRVCLQVSEVEEARGLSLRLAKEHLGDNVLHNAMNFANLVSVAVRTRDFDLLQRLLEAFAWKSYSNHPACKVALKDALYRLQGMSKSAKTMKEASSLEAPMAGVRIALQGVLQARATTHKAIRAQIKFDANEQIKFESLQRAKFQAYQLRMRKKRWGYKRIARGPMNAGDYGWPDENMRSEKVPVALVPVVSGRDGRAD